MFFLVKRIIGIVCAKNCTDEFKFVKVIEEKLYTLFLDMVYIFVKCYNAIASKALTVSGYRAHHQTIFLVQYINLKACTLVILKHLLTRESNPSLANSH